MNVPYWQNKTVFVTGAGGFIGSHLVEALVRNGARVKAMVRYNSSNNWGFLDTMPKDVLSSVEVCPGDVRDSGFVKQFTKGCDHGFHLAALISIPYSYQAPRSYVDTNIMGTLNVLDACLEQGIERLVCTSTSEVYGTAQSVPIDETHPLQGQSPYSASKIGADQIAESYFRSFNLPVVLLRPFNTYGPRQSMRAIIPNIIRQGLAENTIQVGNLSPTRDFNFVLDTVQGFLLAGSTPEAEGQVINVGSGVEISIKDLITTVETLLGKQLEIVQQEQRFRPNNSEVFRLLANIDKAKTVLGYQPEYPLHKGLELTVQYFAQQEQTAKVALYHV